MVCCLGKGTRKGDASDAPDAVKEGFSRVLLSAVLSVAAWVGCCNFHKQIMRTTVIKYKKC